MSGLVGNWEIEPKAKRPKTRREAFDQVRDTYAYTDWDKTLQQAHLSEIGLPGDWEKFDNEKLKIILGDFERSRMILYSDKAKTPDEKPVKLSPSVPANAKRTLSEWREWATAAFGEDSPAIEFIDRKITAKGADVEIACGDGEFIKMCGQIHADGLAKDERTTTTGKSIRDTLRALSRDAAANNLLADSAAGSGGGVEPALRAEQMSAPAI